jgi:hypothetical protein
VVSPTRHENWWSKLGSPHDRVAINETATAVQRCAQAAVQTRLSVLSVLLNRQRAQLLRALGLRVAAAHPHFDQRTQ